MSKKERLMNFLELLIDARMKPLLLRGAFGINILLPLSRKELIVDSSTFARFHCGMSLITHDKYYSTYMFLS